MLCHSMLCANRLAFVLSALPLSLQYAFTAFRFGQYIVGTRPDSIFHKPQTNCKVDGCKGACQERRRLRLSPCQRLQCLALK